MAFLGLLGLFTYAGAIPAHLFRRLKKESQDEAEQRFDPDFMESHGWLVRCIRSSAAFSCLTPEDPQVLRYKPERWWFEFPMIAYKITVVTASTLMDSEAKAKLLLCVLTSAAVLLLLVVTAYKPYRDGQGHDGRTAADELQLLTLSAQIANYGVAFWCLTTQEDRKAAGQEPSTSGSFLSDGEELGVALATLFFTVAPLVPPTIAALKEHQAKQLQGKADRRRDKDAMDEAPGAEIEDGGEEQGGAIEVTESPLDLAT